MTVPDRLRATAARAAPRLLALPRPATRPAPEAWSPQEVVGHLVDSAVVNTARVVRASLGGGLVFEGYDQDGWVRAGRYGGAHWPALVGLWRGLNEHLAAVIEGVSPEAMGRPQHPHSLHRTAWQTVPEGEPTTLGYVASDYLGHLRHHLRAIHPDLVG